MKILDAILALLLLAAAAVKFNDPDPGLWVAIYGIAAAVPLASALGKSNPTLTLAALVVCGVALLLSLPGFFEYLSHHFGDTILEGMSAERMYIEETREFLGALFALLIVVMYWFRGRKAGRHAG
jgi:hypothetical protein